jgi:hypothetical protein
MRFLMIVKATKESEAGVMPTEQELAEMARYNEQLVKAGAMLDGAGLHPSREGVRVNFDTGKPRVIDGPFAETKELIAGYWLVKEGEVEIRQLFELEEFTQGPAIEHHRRSARSTRSRAWGRRWGTPAWPTWPTGWRISWTRCGSASSPRHPRCSSSPGG